MKEYLSKTGSETGMMNLINEELEDAGIPAKIHYDILTNGETTMPDREERDISLSKKKSMHQRRKKTSMWKKYETYMELNQ